MDQTMLHLQKKDNSPFIGLLRMQVGKKKTKLVVLKVCCWDCCGDRRLNNSEWSMIKAIKEVFLKCFGKHHWLVNREKHSQGGDIWARGGKRKAARPRRETNRLPLWETGPGSGQKTRGARVQGTCWGVVENKLKEAGWDCTCGNK